MLAANVISVTGDSLAQLGVPWYVLESTGSSVRAGVVAFCALLPVAVCAWASGPFIDRAGRLRDQRRRDPAAADLRRPELGGVLITAMGASHVLLVDAGTFGVSAVLVASGLRDLPAARPSSPVSGAGTSHQGSFGESLGFLLRMPPLLGICLTTLAAQGLDQGWSSVLLYGAVAHRWRRRAVFAVAFLIVGAPRFAVAALTGSVAPLAVMMAVEGLACGALNPIRATVVYETVPEHLRSRVVGVMTSAGLMAAPLGGLVAGLLVGDAGLFTTLLVTGGVYLAVTLWPATSASWREMDPG
ncbi:MAG TPA: MFS transporter [Trebonia sp.]|nr:MFS transporter [Trebonia sp.]